MIPLKELFLGELFLKGREFTPPIETETKVATAEKARAILRGRIETIKKRTEDPPIGIHQMNREAGLGSITSDSNVLLEIKRGKEKVEETVVDRETFVQVLFSLMESYGANAYRWQSSGGPWSRHWEQKDCLTRHPYLVFRSKTSSDKEGKVRSVNFSVVCTRLRFSLL